MAFIRRSAASISFERLEERELLSNWIPGPEHRALTVGSDRGVTARTWTFPGTQGPSPIVTYAESVGTPVFESSFQGGVRLAKARHFDPLGGTITVMASGPGRPAEVRVVVPGWGPHLSQQGYTTSITPFESGYTGGAFAAVGDFASAGNRDLVISADEGGGPRIRIIRNEDPGNVVADFFGLEDTAFRGGTRTAVGDVNGDGSPDLVIAAGSGGGPRIAIWDGTTLRAGVTPRKLVDDFFIFESTLRSGVFVACADLNGDGFDDVIAGSDRGGGPRVFAVSGQSLLSTGSLTPVANFFAADPNDRGGVRLAVKDIDGDDRADLLTAAGTPVHALLAYAGITIPANGPPPVAKRFEVHEPFTDRDLGFGGGVFLG